MTTLFGRLVASRIRLFGQNTRASVLTLFGFAVIPMIAMIGVAFDYARDATIRTQLNEIADTAALSAVSRTSVGSLASSTDNGQAAAKTYFLAQANLVGGVTIDSVTVTITRTATNLTAAVSYTARVANEFGLVIVNPTTAIAGRATADTALPIYMDFYLMLDNSPSMGLGATQADIDKLVAATKNNKNDPSCAFACHDLSQNGNDYYALAKKLSVTMRIDVVRQATQQLMDYAKATRMFDDQFRVAVYTFGDAMNRIVDRTADLDKAKTAAAAIDLQSVPKQNYNQDRYTNFDGLLPQMNTTIPAGGSGSSGASPKTFMFLVTDGVADENTPGNASGRTIAPITVAQCDAIKSRGVQIAVLYTTYYPLPTNAFYNSFVAPWASTIGPKLKACASDGFYFEVSPSEGISQAMQALFQKAVAQARLTQ